MSEIYSEEPPINEVHIVDMPEPESQLELQGAILYSLNQSRIWLNGYHCVRPSDEFLRDLGATVLTLLNNPANCLPAIDMRAKDAQAPLSEAQRKTQALYLRVMKS